MTDPQIYNLLRSLSSDDDKVAYAYAVLREERDERLRVSKYDFLKALAFIFAGFAAVYMVLYFIIPSPCQ